jgi:hypothetical protein
VEEAVEEAVEEEAEGAVDAGWTVRATRVG